MLAQIVFSLAIPLGLDRYMTVPKDNPLSRASIQRGEALFFDPRLSADGSLSCASCHEPSRAFSDARAIAVGIGHRAGRRNSPALVNRGYGRVFFWDGRAATLEAQVVQPIEDLNELGSSLASAAERVGVAPNQIGRDLASFVRSILSGNSRFDRFMDSHVDALTPEEKAGLDLFRGKAHCVTCHVGPNFTDERVHNTGIAWRDGHMTDEGAGRGAFKTPTLREVARTGPYMHDGSLTTLREVIDHYDAGGSPNPFLDPSLRPLSLTSDEKRQLVAFLATLSGEVRFGVAHDATPMADSTQNLREWSVFDGHYRRSALWVPRRIRNVNVEAIRFPSQGGFPHRRN
jgi:cytochrome c peroxidase